MKYTIKNDEIADFNESKTFEFPKYTSQLINWANQNAQGTRSNVVGRMSDLFPQFMKECNEITIENWKNGTSKSIPLHSKQPQIKYMHRFKILRMQFL